MNIDRHRLSSVQFLGLLASVAALCGCGAEPSGSDGAAATGAAGTSTASSPVATTTAGSSGSPSTSDTNPPTGDGTAPTPAPVTGTETTPVAGSTPQSPTITGTPTEAVLVGRTYDFAPTIGAVSGPNAVFTVVNAPSWASFNTATGQLFGTPTAGDVGTYSNISISVRNSSNGTSASLPPFSIAVLQSATGQAVLSWSPTTQNVRGGAVTGLAGYRIFYGSNVSSMTQSVEVGPNITTVMVGNLMPGIWYFDIRAFTSTGQESASSNVASKTIS